MTLSHEGSDGFWVATSEEVAKHLGYETGKFGNGFVAGRWSGYLTDLAGQRWLCLADNWVPISLAPSHERNGK